jgi:hypothetical protein
MAKKPNQKANGNSASEDAGSGHGPQGGGNAELQETAGGVGERPDVIPSAPAVSEKTGLDAIAEVMTREMSEPRPNAVAALNPDNTDKPQNDALDVGQDPGPKKRGRPKGSTNRRSRLGSIQQEPAPGNVAEKQQLDIAAQTAMAAGTATHLTILTGIMIGGTDFQPMKNPMVGGMDDAEFLNKAYTDYFQAKGVTDIPPGVALTAALMCYVAPRFRLPETQSRTKKFALWISEKWAKFRNRKNAAHVVSRDDGKRQDNAQQRPVASVPNAGN